MSRLAQPPPRTFDQLLLPTTTPKLCQPLRFSMANLFDLSTETPRPMRSELRIRREEDSERWDGLS